MIKTKSYSTLSSFTNYVDTVRDTHQTKDKAIQHLIKAVSNFTPDPSFRVDNFFCQLILSIQDLSISLEDKRLSPTNLCQQINKNLSYENSAKGYFTNQMLNAYLASHPSAVNKNVLANFPLFRGVIYQISYQSNHKIEISYLNGTNISHWFHLVLNLLNKMLADDSVSKV